MVLAQSLGLAIPLALIGGIIYYRDEIFAHLKLPEFDLEEAISKIINPTNKI